MLFLAIPLIAQLVSAACAAEVAEIPVATLAEGAACACRQLASQYGNLTLYGNSTGYTEQSINYWDTRSDLAPNCIFLPTDKDQVAKAISIFASCGTQFAVRGGGHMNVGCSRRLLCFLKSR